MYCCLRNNRHRQILNQYLYSKCILGSQDLLLSLYWCKITFCLFYYWLVKSFEMAVADFNEENNFKSHFRAVMENLYFYRTRNLNQLFASSHNFLITKKKDLFSGISTSIFLCVNFYSRLEWKSNNFLMQNWQFYCIIWSLVEYINTYFFLCSLKVSSKQTT